MIAGGSTRYIYLCFDPFILSHSHKGSANVVGSTSQWYGDGEEEGEHEV